MAYVKTNWQDYPSTATAIDADALNHMEQGIFDNDAMIGTKLDSANPSFSGDMSGSGNVTVGGEVENGNGETLHGAYQSAENVLPIDTESGNPAVITDAFGGACKSLKLTLEPIQSGSGTPSPQNVRPITGRTQNVVTRTGANLYNPSAVQNGYIDANGVYQPYDASVQATGYMGVIPSTTYTFYYKRTASIGDPAIRIAWYDDEMHFIQRDSVSSGNITGVFYAQYTAPATASYVRVSSCSSSYATNYMFAKDITEYVAYNGESITRTYGTTIYGGTDDVTGDGAISTRGIAVANDFPSSWYGTSVGGLHWGTLPIANIDITKTAISSMLPYKTSGAAWNSPTPCFTMNAEGIRVYVTESTVADFKANYANLQICYTLATPTSIPLTAQNITLLHGDNVITTDADSIETSYSADIALYIEKKIAEGSQNNRNLSKGGSGDEESKEEVKEEEKKEEEPKEVEVNER